MQWYLMRHVCKPEAWSLTTPHDVEQALTGYLHTDPAGTLSKHSSLRLLGHSSTEVAAHEGIGTVCSVVHASTAPGCETAG